MENKTHTRCHIHIGDCRDVLRTLPERSVHLVVTSPPYNLNLQYGKWNDQMPFEDYMRFTREWLEECYRVLRDDGRICVNIPIATFKNHKRNLLMAYHNLMTEIGFIDRELILWVKTFRSKLANSYKVYGTWNPANPLMDYPCEAVIVMNKKEKRLNGWKSDLNRSELFEWRKNMWTITPELDRSHPAPFPEELPRRLIKFFSFVGQTVLDPFLGSGTTMKVAHMLNRRCIGIELDDRYLEIIKRKAGIGQKDLVITYHAKPDRFDVSGRETSIGPDGIAESDRGRMFDWKGREDDMERFFDS